MIDANYGDVAKKLEKRINCVSKPCWELEYCPYGPLVEYFPIPPIERHYAIEHNEYLKKCLSTGLLGSGEQLDEKKRKDFENMVNDFNPEDYPEELSESEIDAECTVFGHLCPVFFVSESFAETRDMDTIDRIIQDTI